MQWTSNGVIDSHARALGLPAPDPDVAIIMLETEVSRTTHVLIPNLLLMGLVYSLQVGVPP